MIPTAPPVRDAAPARKVFVTGAGRCGECHGKMFDEWETSAHARAATSATYRAAVASAKDPACDRCHAPLASVVGRDVVATEGVTCDVCHTLRDPAPGPRGGGFRLAVDDMVKYGPRCDLTDHYFHRMGCSTEHRQAALCGSCHWWEPSGVPVLTELPDWRAGPSADTPCQFCHMPGEPAALAVGSPERDGVPDHRLLGAAGDLRRRAIQLEASLRIQREGVIVAVAVTNVGAGHYIPAGLPERRLVVRVIVGGEVQTRSLGRILVDAGGTEVPFWRAKRVARDTRIAPGARWEDRFVFGGRGDAVVEVVEHALSDATAHELGVTAERYELARARVAPGAHATVKPRPPGGRPKP